MDIDMQKADELQEQLETYIGTYWQLFRRSSRLNNALVISGLMLGMGVTITGFMEWDKWPGILGMLTTLLLGFHSAYNFGGQAAFLHAIHDQAKILRDRLRYQVTTQEEFDSVFEDFTSLRMQAVLQLPRGSGMNAVSSPS